MTFKNKQAPEKQRFDIKPNSDWREDKSLEEALDAIHEKLCAQSSCVDVGCIRAEGVVTGRVLACFTADGVSYTAVIPGQPPITDYAGEWELCDSVVSSVVPISTVCYQ